VRGVFDHAEIGCDLFGLPSRLSTDRVDFKAGQSGRVSLPYLR
jgi:hypothetical protein